MLKALFFTLAAINFAHSLPSQYTYVKGNTQENIERLKNLSPDDNAELYGGQFEGDMILSTEEIDTLLNGARDERTGLRDERYRWTNKIVPYQIREEDFDSAQIHYITLGLQNLAAATCLSFVPFNAAQHTNYIWVTGENSGCWSYVGMRGGRQQLNLQKYEPGSGCFRIGTIMHEFLHALGFYHMQSSYDRDNYVEIVWANIQSGTENNFNLISESAINNFGVEYDYGSVMHYPATAFSVNGQPTIIPLLPLNGAVMGQRTHLTQKDIDRTRRMYNCDA